MSRHICISRSTFPGPVIRPSNVPMTRLAWANHLGCCSTNSKSPTVILPFALQLFHELSITHRLLANSGSITIWESIDSRASLVEELTGTQPILFSHSRQYIET